MSFFGSDASCGPVNPLQNFGKHSGATSSAQNQRFVGSSSGTSSFRSSPAPGQSATVQADLNAFARPEMGPAMPVMDHSMGAGHILSRPPPTQMMRSGASQVPDWASEFSRLSVGEQGSMQQTSAAWANQSSMGHQHLQYQMPHAPQSMMQMPSQLSAHQTSSSFAQQAEHFQMHKMSSQDVAFDSAFAEAERSLHASSPQLDTSMESQQNAAAPVTDQNPDLSGVAQSIVQNMSNAEGRSSAMVDKMRNSNFVALMSHLSNQSVKLDGNKFVDASGSEVDVETLERPTIHEAAEPPVQSPRAVTPPATEPVLEDPFAYMERMGRRVDPVTTPFELAQAVTPGGLKTNTWEEKFDEEGWAR